MEWVNGISAGDRTLLRRCSIALIALFLFTFAYSQLDLFYSHKFLDTTGSAEWIWAHHPISRGIPIAFFVTRDFDLAPDRYFVKIKIAADPEYTLWFNGQMIAGRRGENGNLLDVYDVTKLAHDGRNRIVIAARSANGVGGVIASVDTRPDFHLLATDRKWHVVRRWSDDLPLQDPSSVSTPMIIGRPPAGRWNYLTARDGEFMKPATRVVEPLQAIPVRAALPDISIISGVAVAGSHPTPGVAYDFGSGIDGRVQLTREPTMTASRLVHIRRGYHMTDLTPAEGEVESFVFAPGERTITDTQTHNFRFVLVYAGDAAVRAVQ